MSLQIQKRFLNKRLRHLGRFGSMDLVSLGRKNPILYNVLGLEVLLLRIKHQVDRYKAVDKRIFQLSDPYIYIYALAWLAKVVLEAGNLIVC